MRNIYDVIRHKEADIQQLQKELEALRLAARLLTDEASPEVETLKPMRMAAAATPTTSKADNEVLLSAPLRQFP
jgi:type II secretory pathway component PulM